MDDLNMDFVESLPLGRGRSGARSRSYASSSNLVAAAHGCRIGCGTVLGGGSMATLLLVEPVGKTLEHTFLSGFWHVVEPVLSGGGTIGFFIGAGIIGWQVYEMRRVRRAEDAKVGLLEEGYRQSREVTSIIRESRRNGDNVEVQLEHGLVKGVKVIRREVLLEQVRVQTEKQMWRGARGGEIGRSAQLALSAPGLEPSPAPGETVVEEEEEPIPIPVAPRFWDIVDLITEDSMPLCFVIDDDPESPTYGQTVPAFGTMLDLLSLCVIGKPGRGKSVLLLFYICALARYGAEIHVLDPQGAFAELELLHGRPLPAMPPTARIYYYSSFEEMEKVVDEIEAEIKDRERLYKPHVEQGRLKRQTLKHPLVIMADELPIIAEMDVEIKKKTKEENKARRLEGDVEVKIRQVTTMIKTSVLAARKYGVYFIGASQSIDATILPTRVTAGFNSRIVFSSSEQKARMAGLDSDVAKRLLPVINRAGPGKTIYDCGRWAKPRVAAIPFVSIDDVLEFFGMSMEELEALWVAELTARGQQERAGQEKGTRMTDPLVVDASPLAPAPTRKVQPRRATVADAIEVWNAAEAEIGRPRLREELQARGLECSDDLAKQLLKAVKQRLESAGDEDSGSVSSSH